MRSLDWSFGLAIYILTACLISLTGSLFTENHELVSGFSLLVLCAAFIVTICIFYAKNKGVINNVNIWFVISAFALVFSVVSANFAWIDLFEPYLLRVDDPLAVQDANKYDLSGLLLLETGRGLGHWQSYAVDRYIYFIYKYFGVETVNVAVVNYVLRFVSIIVASFILNEVDKRKSSDFVSLLYFLPLGFYYSIMPSKEPITLLFFHLFAFYLIRLVKEFNLKNLILVGVYIFCISSIRLNLGLFCIVALMVVLFVFLDNAAHKAILISACLFLLLPINMVSLATLNISIVDLVIKYENIFDISERLSDSNMTGFAQKLKELNASFGLIGYFILLPIKMLIVFLSPFPLLNIDFMYFIEHSNGKGIEAVNNVYKLFSSTSAMLNVFFILPIISSFVSCYNSNKKSIRAFTVFVLTVFTIISLIYVSGFTRIRTLFEILLFLLLFLHFRFTALHVVFPAIVISVAIAINFLLIT
jgi:hypothetical protein